MICPYCGTDNRSMAKFCDSCGGELPTVAPDAREMFSDDSFLLEGQDAVTVDLQGLERMVDSSNSGVMFQDAYDAYIDPQDSYAPTVSLDDRTSVLDSGYVDHTEQVLFDDPYATRTIDLADPYPYKTAELIPVKDASSAKGASYDAAARTFSADGMPLDNKKARGGSRRKVVAIVLAIVVAALLAAAALVTYNLQLWGGISVPDVVRQTESVAKQNLEAAGFAVDVEYVVSDDTEGIVVSTNPSAGSRIEEGSLVMISVSIPRVIPEVLGLAKDDALALLNKSGYEDIEIVSQKSNEAQDSVVAVDPAVGDEARADAHITLSVAEPYRVPAVEGMTRDEAIAALEAEGYTVKTVSYITEDIQEGMAVSTDPGSGVALPSGSEVVLNIAHNRSKELIDVTHAFFNGSTRFSIGGMNYELSKVESVTYKGSDTCAYKIVARPYETHTWLFGETETRYGNYETIEGTIVFNADNSIRSSDPSIKRIG